MTNSEARIPSKHGVPVRSFHLGFRSSDFPWVFGCFVNHHKRIAVKGTEGELLWSMWGWSRTTSEGESSGSHDYFEEDILGQAAMVESMIKWMEDDADAMPLCLGKALADFEIVMGMYQSVIHNRTIEFLPSSPSGLRRTRGQPWAEIHSPVGASDSCYDVTDSSLFASDSPRQGQFMETDPHSPKRLIGARASTFSCKPMILRR